MTDRRRIGCAAESLRRQEPLLGTASRVRRWLIVEQPGHWGSNALLESHLDRDVARTLQSRSRRHGVRVVLIRRPGWRKAGTRRVYLAQSNPDPGRSWVEQLDVEDVRALPRVDLASLGADDPPGVGVPGPATVHLVCTNGRHDACCANLGRPVVHALEIAGTPEVWESSHIGGDRFAANIVCLPAGVYFGRVPPEQASRLLADFAGGHIDLDCYRGRSCFPPLIQAAEIFARRELAETRLDHLRVVSAVRHGDDGLTAVLVHEEQQRVAVTVGRERGPAEHLTCGDHGMSRPWRYRLVALDVTES
ncbi:MAG: sucrase ferredoxin [Acidimicrobiales bacterium]